MLSISLEFTKSSLSASALQRFSFGGRRFLAAASRAEEVVLVLEGEVETDRFGEVGADFFCEAGESVERLRLVAVRGGFCRREWTGALELDAARVTLSADLLSEIVFARAASFSSWYRCLRRRLGENRRI